ncbi:myrosinase 1-like [Leptidea sinapis]|uniref:myrosinase 1-like n=1 Tax=Leptidea sinapis TaxID=189913 RepID=UPI00213C060A|nr:myrosinase 1-like [Leptidea sinapis]
MVIPVIFLLCICLTHAVQGLSLNQSTFPPNFMIGASTSAYQTEGAWNVDGRGESSWDFVYHTIPDKVGYIHGDEAANSYYLWQKDVEIAKEMGLDFYRFSISWSRILPDGFVYNINDKGVQYYNNLINALLAEGIEPVVTMYHLDLPNALQIQGGWVHPNIINWFMDYAKLLFSLYADRVKYWLTLNEPQIFCDDYYFHTYNPPLGTDILFAPSICNKHSLLAHAMVYRYYQDVYKEKYNGLISLSSMYLWCAPSNTRNFLDIGAADMIQQFINGRVLHPIFSKKGGWPPIFERFMYGISLQKGFNGSILPLFTEEEKSLIKGSADYIALNYYAGLKISMNDLLYEPKLYDLLGIKARFIFEFEGSYMTPGLGHNIYPRGLKKMGKWITKHYGNWDILITENGYGDIDRTLTDNTRIKVIKESLEQVLQSIYEDGTRFIGYSYWSLIDAFSFTKGFNITFGLWDVDFNDPERPRTARDSARYFTCITQKRQLEACDYLVKQ